MREYFIKLLIKYCQQGTKYNYTQLSFIPLCKYDIFSFLFSYLMFFVIITSTEKRQSSYSLQIKKVNVQFD